MNWLAQFDWRAPAWGVLALLPLVMEGLAGWRKRRAGVYSDAALRPWAVHDTAARGWGLAQRAFHLLAWGLLAAALAGPRLPLPAGHGTIAPGKLLHGLTIYAVLDISPAMQVADVAPNRLVRARLKLLDLLARLHGERLGLIVYSGSAGLLSPPSNDPRVLRDALDLVQPGLIQQVGDDPAAALTLALDQARQHAGPSAVLLVSDASGQSLEGASGAAVRGAVAALARAQVPLFILGVATPAGAVLAAADGGAVVSRLDAPAYRALAASTRGEFAQVTDGDRDWQALYDRGIARLPGKTPTIVKPRAWREFYPWLLAPALALMLLLYLPRAGGRLVLVALGAFILAPSPRAHADDVLQAAWHAWRDAHWAVAQARYERAGGYAGALGAGAAAWQLGDYAVAARHFSTALLLATTPGQRLDALYDLGNALYGLGNWGAAAQAFQSVLRLRPQDARARANLHMSLWRLRQHAPHPLPPTGVRARPGLAAVGEVDLDWDSAAVVQHLKPAPLGPLIERGAISGAGASLQGGQTGAGGGAIDVSGWQSGFKKMQWLHDRRRTLARGLLTQDTATLGAEQ